MADQEWLKNLSQALLSTDKKSLVPADPEEIHALLCQRIETSMNQLFNEANNSIKIYNFHASKERQISLFTLKPSEYKKDYGLVMSKGRVQAKLIYREGILSSSITTASAFNVEEMHQNLYSPFVDKFGSLMWKKDNTVLFTNENIVKEILEDLTLVFAKEHAEKGDIN